MWFSRLLPYVHSYTIYVRPTTHTHTGDFTHSGSRETKTAVPPLTHTYTEYIHRAHTHTHGKQKYECEWETATSPRRCSHSSTCDCCVSSFGCVVGHRRRSRHYDHPKGLRCIECSVSCCCIDARYKNGNFVHIIRPVTVHNPSCCTDLRKIHFKTHKI